MRKQLPKSRPSDVNTNGSVRIEHIGYAILFARGRAVTYTIREHHTNDTRIPVENWHCQDNAAMETMF